MELRQYFTKKIWWGKLIGAFFGFMIAGSIGALFGVLIGNFFDRGLVEHFNKPFWHYYNEKNKSTQEVFFKAMFAILGHIAKANGRVSELDIINANKVMTKMELNNKEKKLAQHYFNFGKEKNFNLLIMLNSLQSAIGKNPALIRLFVETQYQYIRNTGITMAKLNILNNLLASLRMAPLHQQNHFNDEYVWHNTRQNNYQKQENYRSKNYKEWPGTINNENYYAILGIKSNASREEVKQAYRRQISLNHPDKLIAKGLSEEKIKEANIKTQTIRKAYEEICKLREWK